MSTYVMSDIHGCYDEMQMMLEQIQFSTDDKLILAGDYIDRGYQSYEMLNWIMTCPDNVILLRGNHDQEFVYHVELMQKMCAKQEMDAASVEDTARMYMLISRRGIETSQFDRYGTIRELIEKKQVVLTQFTAWEEAICKMPFVRFCDVNGKKYAVVHAGYIADLHKAGLDGVYDSVEDFYLCARREAYTLGGLPHGTVIAGHTPTTVRGQFPYNEGNVFYYYDEYRDCSFYDIDCGCSSRWAKPGAKLACIRLDDETIFYI